MGHAASTLQASRQAGRLPSALNTVAVKLRRVRRSCRPTSLPRPCSHIPRHIPRTRTAPNRW